MPTSLPSYPLQIDLLKITGYLLNANHPQGAAKAKYFASYGFSLSDPNTFAQALVAHARQAALESRRMDKYGVTTTYRGKLNCPNGFTSSDVRTVWQTAPDAKVSRLVTAYPC